MGPYSRVHCFSYLNTSLSRRQKFADFGRVIFRIFGSLGGQEGCMRGAILYRIIENYSQFEVRYITYFAFALKCLATEGYVFFLSRTPVRAQAHSTLSQAAKIYAYRRQCDGILSGQTKRIVTSVALESIVKAKRYF